MQLAPSTSSPLGFDASGTLHLKSAARGTGVPLQRSKSTVKIRPFGRTAMPAIAMISSVSVSLGALMKLAGTSATRAFTSGRFSNSGMPTASSG